eukprot:Blabericola_migrator_1__11630@NODE_69_length_15356_cov_75_151481_g62_i0_p2_GENE_NODE_69_length_15356_cov_75_151481_g62_i0NODE_69_length_15356_cov_75_151481_g62_i0_p2_ORF_typecomplete_len769_score132_83Pox_MCEL/PF03291_16/2_3e60Methyltransf_31/PF13847_6/6_4e02Methyltransf_31/PF13847_6/8_1e12Methyltransf_25/PF13649_6/4_9e03Methyltransf_25/PF13649_6/8_9e11Methyltransf_23/PF13489_6/2_5e10Methyltransf_11/PF08241_12/1_7e08Methyltransf_11/PF08241_12/3_5e03Ubie_methyltran/PF01209_18/4_1e08Methyltransf_2
MRPRGRGRRGGHQHNNNNLESLLGHTQELNATAQFVQNATSDAGKVESDFFLNPRIRATLDRFHHISIFKEHSNLSQEILVVLHNLLVSAINGNVSKLRIRLGRLVGTASRDAVNLPILSDAVLCKEDLTLGTQIVSMNYDFSEAAQQQMSSNLTRVLLDRVQNAECQGLELEDLKKTEVLVDIYPDGVFTHKDPANPSQVLERFKITELDSVVIYRATKGVHLRFVAENHLPYAEAPPGPVLMSERRSIETQLLRDPDGGLLEWEVTTVRVDPANEVSEYDEGESTYEFSFSLGDTTWNLLRQLGALFGEQETELAAEWDSAIKAMTVALLGNARILASFDDSDTAGDKHYYPSLFGDIVADTRKHYNLKKIGVATRSAIEIVRRSNNMAKRLLIDDWVATGSSVLDLACGHGQDLLKYGKKELKLFVGVDVSNEEIKEARQRYRKQQSGRGGPAPPPCRFHVGNLLLPASYDKFLKSDPTLDVVSVQLAIHYCLETEDNARLVLSSIADHLKPGGIFIGSCPSCFVIHERMRRSLRRRVTKEDDLDYSFGNKVYNVSFSSQEFENLTGAPDEDADGKSREEIPNLPVRLPGDPSYPPHPWVQEFFQQRLERVPMGFGHKDLTTHALIDNDPFLLQLNERWGIRYTFWLIDHIDAAEYVVPWRAFCRLAKEYNLACLLTCPFDLYTEGMVQRGNVEAVEFKRRTETLIAENSTAAEQGEVISFYQVFAFQKMMSEEDREKTLELATQPPALSAFNKAQMVSANVGLY